MIAIHKRVPVLSLALVFALAASSCNGDKPANNQQNANQSATAAKPGYWIAQYRSPASKAYESSYLAVFSYNDISVVSSEVVFVAAEVPAPGEKEGRLGMVVRTIDGGKNWTELSVQQSGLKIPTLNAIHFVDPNLGWVVGVDSKKEGVLLKTTDGGATWTASKPGFKQSPTTIFFIDANTGWMGGLNPPLDEEEGEGGPTDILMTTDGGATWQAQRRVPVTIYDIFFLDRMTGWAAGTGGSIYHTTDGGRVWQAQRSELENVTQPNIPAPVIFTVTGIHFADKDHGWAAASEEDEEEGRILGTENGGAAWTRQRVVDGAGVRDVFFTDATTGWAATNQGLFIHYTNDGGRTWTAERVEFPQVIAIYRIEAADASRAWAVGGGAIFYRVTE